MLGRMVKSRKKKMMKQMTTRLVLTGLVIATGFAAQAASDDTTKPGKMRHERPSFSALDTDNNGELTREELGAQAKLRFDKADANGDGKLSAEELGQNGKKRAEERAAKMIERLDADKDGMLSQDELSKSRKGDRAEKMFDRVDADNNGTISEEEFAKLGKRGHGKKKRMKSGE